MSYTSNTQKKTYIRPSICVSLIADTFMICQTNRSVSLKRGSADNSTSYARERSGEVVDEGIGFGALWE